MLLLTIPSSQLIDISANSIEEISSDVGLLENLGQLLAADNNIKEIPKEIGALEYLEQLSVAFNCLTSIPSELGNLSSLQVRMPFNDAPLLWVLLFLLSSFCHKLDPASKFVATIIIARRLMELLVTVWFRYTGLVFVLQRH